MQCLDCADPEDHDQIPVETKLRQQARISEFAGRKAALVSYRERLQAFGEELAKDNAAWEAERGLYERKLATARWMEASSSVALQPNFSGALSDGGSEAPASMTRDTLLSVAAAPVLAARKEAVESDGSVSRYAEGYIAP